MSISVQRLEELLDRLRNLERRLQASSRPADSPLAPDDPLVQLANDCEFFLPSPLCIATLAPTVERKIENVMVLLERARQREEIPADAQAAAENEDNLVLENRPPDRLRAMRASARRS
jgi:hypothetical protein